MGQTRSIIRGGTRLLRHREGGSSYRWGLSWERYVSVQRAGFGCEQGWFLYGWHQQCLSSPDAFARRHIVLFICWQLFTPEASVAMPSEP